MNSLNVIVVSCVLEFRGEIPDQHAEDDERHPEQQTFQRRVQAGPPLRSAELRACHTRLQDYHGLRGVRYPKRLVDSVTRRPTRSDRLHRPRAAPHRGRARATLRSTKKSCSFFRPSSPTGLKRSPGRRFRTAKCPRQRSPRTMATPAAAARSPRCPPLHCGRPSGPRQSSRLREARLPWDRQRIPEKVRCSGPSGPRRPTC